MKPIVIKKTIPKCTVFLTFEKNCDTYISRSVAMINIYYTSAVTCTCCSCHVMGRVIDPVLSGGYLPF